MSRTIVRRVAGCLAVLATLAIPARALAASPPTATTTAVAAACTGTTSCTAMLLATINRHREHHHLAPLQLAPAQSHGQAGCPGSYGHSVAMARTGGIWHTNDRYPHQSFPHNICMRYVYTGENVGEAFSGDESQDILLLDHLMMKEPHSVAACASTVNHACNILDAHFRAVGIGLYEEHGATWLTEDFIG